MGAEVGVGESPAPASAVIPANPGRPDQKFERQSLGRTWLIGLAVVPFLLAIIGFGAYGRPTGVNGPTGNLPILSVTAGRVPTEPSLSLSLLSISRNGNTITLIGDFPDEAAKAALMKSVTLLATPGVNIVDQIHIDPLVHSLNFVNSDPVFTAGAPIADFNLTVNKDTVTLAGTATSPDQKDAVERAVVAAWPDVNVTNKIVARGQAAPDAPPGPAPEPPPGPAACNGLQAAINAITGGPLAFGNDGVSLTPDDNQILIRVADKLKACPSAKVGVNGYADNQGSEAINIPLSTQRAQAVADYLIAHGVTRERVTAKGLGSANPIVSNDTAEGRAKNRRAELVVG